MARSLCFRVRVDDFGAFVLPFCSFKRYRLGLTGHHTFPRTCLWSVCFSFFCPRRVFTIAHSGRASLLFWRVLGLRFWALRVLEFLDSLGTSRGFPFLDSRRQGCLCRFSFVVFVFTFFVVFAAAHVVLEGPPRDLAEAGPGV